MGFGAGSMQNQISAQNNAAAQQYRTQAAGQYGDLSAAGGNVAQSGQQQYSQYNTLLNQLLPQYETAAGIGGGGPGMGTVAQPAGGQPSPSMGGQPSPSMGGQPSPMTTNPYQLTPAQQQQLNAQIDVINRRQQADAAALQAHAASQGISDPSHYQAALENLNQQYGQLAADHSAQFMENARQSTLGNINNLMGFGAQQEGAGSQRQMGGYGMQEASAGGIAGLSGAAQSGAQQAAQTALQQQQAENQLVGGILGGAMQLGGYAAGGGFRGVNPVMSAALEQGGSNTPLTIPSADTFDTNNIWQGVDSPIRTPTQQYFVDPATGLARGQAAA